MVDLHLGHGSAGVDGVRHRGEVRRGGRVVDADLLGMAASCVQVDDHVADGHDGGPAQGAQLVILDIFAGIVLLRSQLREGRG